jgi:DNA-binding CsgD family transcriptional regulator
MSKSGSLRVLDVSNVFRLIGDCRDLGTDPDLWNQRMIEGLTWLVGCSSVTTGEGVWFRSAKSLRWPVKRFCVGFDDKERSYLIRYVREGHFVADPLVRAIGKSTARLITCTRRELVTDPDWYGSVSYNEFRRPAGIDDQLSSVYSAGDRGAIDVVTMHRRPGERPFSLRERNILNFFHGELGRLIGGALVSAEEPGPDGLSRRLRQTLMCLIEGDSEKQVAGRLGLSQATAHQYVTSLYRFFSVRSRGQLMAHILRRVGSGQWKFFCK